jgi:pimeloyl-ACP methyl ester carboxylesterase
MAAPPRRGDAFSGQLSAPRPVNNQAFFKNSSRSDQGLLAREGAFSVSQPTLAIGIAPKRNGSEDLMSIQQLSPANPDSTPVIALHCSGAGAGEWRQLGEALGSAYTLFAPEHYGCEQTGPWTGGHAFTLADEAARTIALIDESETKVHLVGHSYGGGLALHVALARPDRIASLSLYEPSAFHLLKIIDDKGSAAFTEIADITRVTGQGVIAGDYAGAAAAFVDYWGGVGAWSALRPTAQAALVRWAPKAPLDFRALIEEPTLLTAYRDLRMPVLVMRGEHAPRPTRTIAEVLSSMLSEARQVVVDGAGHMGPFTHKSVVAELIAEHIVSTDFAVPRSNRSHSDVAAWSSGALSLGGAG